MFTWLDLHLDIEICGNYFASYHYKVKRDNYVTFMISKVKHFNLFEFYRYEFLDLKIHLYSNKLDIKFTQEHKIPRKSIKNDCIKTKVFNFFIKQNIALVYFEGDTNLLYGLIELSATELLLGYIKNSIKYKSRLLEKIPEKKRVKMLTKLEKMKNFSYPSIEEYIQDQSDFEVMVSVHNGNRRICYFINTRALPEITPGKKNTKLKNNKIITFSFEGMTEPLESADFNLYFDNDMGISEKIQGLLFCEVIVKDHQKIRFIDSGFRKIEEIDDSEIGFEYSGEDVKRYRVMVDEFGFGYEVMMVIGDDFMRLCDVQLRLHCGFFLS